MWKHLACAKIDLLGTAHYVWVECRPNRWRGFSDVRHHNGEKQPAYVATSPGLQAANHFIRSKLFRHIKSLPMSVLNERRIGDSVYRVMYDTPSITSMCYDIAARTFMATAVLFVGLATFISAYPNNPDLVWLAVLVYPVFLLLSVPFANATRSPARPP